MWSRPPCVDRATFEERTTVTSVVSRIGTASTMIGSESVATVEPATVQLDASPSAASANPSTWLPLSPMNTAAGRRRRRLYGRKPMQAKQMPSESVAIEVARVHRERVDREEGAGDRRERRSEAVHVVEKVEGVRHPDEPDDADARREHRGSPTISTRTPDARTSAAAPPWAPIFASGGRR